MTSGRKRRSLAARVLRSIGRGLRILMMAFAGIGPAPPPLPPPGPEPSAQYQEGRPRATRRR